VAVSLGYINVYRDPRGFPAWQEAGLPVASAPLAEALVPAEAAAPGPLYGLAMLWTLLGIFLGGMALNLTPCVYPLIPITVSYFGGRSGQGRGSLVGHGLLYLLGLALTNSILGVVAALTGGLMGAMLQNPVVLLAVAALLVAFASSLFGLWELRLPSGLTRAASKSYTGYFGTFFMGLTLGVVAAPCLGPFVLGLLTWVAGMGSPWLGFLVFFTLSLGLGLPFFVLAVFSGRIEKLPRSGEWMLWVRKLMGWVLVGMAAYFVRPLLPPPLDTLALAAVAMAAGLHLGFVDRSRAGFAAFAPVKAAVGIGALVLATYLVGSLVLRGPGVAWQPYSDDLLARAAAEGKPVVIDFSAAWCTPCRELDEKTFHDPAVVQKAGREVVMVKVDLTKSGDPGHERLLAAYAVKGVPTVVFLDPAGRERTDLRLVDYLPPEEFLKRLDDLNRQ
jgi:thiol:disulfide interchange protein DsbD